MNNTIRNFKGVWIPKNIWINKDLTLIEKCFLVEVDSLDNEQGCFASNGHFSMFFNISKGRCTQILKSLERKGYLKITVIRKGNLIVKRVVKVTKKMFKKLNNPSELIKQPYLENAQGNNTTINNSKEVSLLKKEIERLKAELDKHKPKELEYKNEIIEIVNFLNEKTGKSFKAKTIATSTLIRARLKDYTVEDFKKVITNKVLQWSGTEFERYLQPSTLFNVNKFESYVNEKSTATVEIEKDDFKLSENQEVIYQEWIEEGKRNYPALINSKTIYLTRKQLLELMIYANKETTRREFTVKEFKRKMKSCFKELNEKKWIRDAWVNSYDYILDEVKKEINK